jgi:putative transposase
MSPPLKYPVCLTADEQAQIKTLTTKGKTSARTIKRAQILSLSHDKKTIQHITDVLDVSAMTVNNIRKKYGAGGLELALYERPRPGRPLIFDGKDRAAITSIACSEPPEGHARWSVRLIADKAIELNVVDDISPATVFHMLKKTRSNRTENGSGASPS